MDPADRKEVLLPNSNQMAGHIESQELQAMCDRVLARLDRTIPEFAMSFPGPSSVDGRYPSIDNNEWTNGFWTGQLWLAWELSGDDRYRAAALATLPSFAERAERKIAVDHHDLGFLYTLSCCAAGRLVGDAEADEAALKAAELLLARFHHKAGIIQAWGNPDDPMQRGRMIIDCNLNLPLLWWARNRTGDSRFSEAADHHIAQAARYLVREDFSTYHTFYIDTETGSPLRGTTHQGFSDESAWSRGQAWGIYGFALAFRHTGDPAYIELASNLSEYFLDRLPVDRVCYWDLIFTDGEEPRDSSAAAIAACGFLELSAMLPLSDSRRERYQAAAVEIVRSLDAGYLAPLLGSNGLLDHAVYHWPNKVGVDECCIWGDYFYLEALLRLKKPWRPYWA